MNFLLSYQLQFEWSSTKKNNNKFLGNGHSLEKIMVNKSI